MHRNRVNHRVQWWKPAFACIFRLALPRDAKTIETHALNSSRAHALGIWHGRSRGSVAGASRSVAGSGPRSRGSVAGASRRVAGICRFSETPSCALACSKLITFNHKPHLWLQINDNIRKRCISSLKSQTRYSFYHSITFLGWINANRFKSYSYDSNLKITTTKPTFRS